MTSCSNNYQLYNQTKKYADKYCENGSVDVTLSDLTDFEWDEALVFRYPTSQQEIEDAIGVRYDGSLDLTNGIIFVKDKEVVYDELFIGDFESAPRFFVYTTNEPTSNGGSQRVYLPSDIFECTKFTKFTKFTDRNYECYSLKPKE